MDEEALRDVFQVIGPIHIRRMFGGKGLYHGDRMFALEAGGELYLKVDAETVAVFRDLGSRPFGYTAKDGKRVVMSYWLMPESGLEDPEEAARYARLAIEAARRSPAASRKRSAKAE